jgi:UDP-3-O-[3-hydroxymyristoyl] glucosamine N-acyltransferase
VADPRFYSVAGPFSLQEIAKIAEARVGDSADVQATFLDVQPLTSADINHISFLDNKLYIDQFIKTQAGACIVHPEFANKSPSGVSLILTENPYRAYALVASAFYPTASLLKKQSSNMLIDDTAIVGKNCEISLGVVIGKNAIIGDNSKISSNSVIGPGVKLGKDCLIGSNVSVFYTLIGDRVFISAGAQIGNDGFGFVPGRENHIKVPQLGRVIIKDNVEIGANCTIDRGSGPDTVIGAGTKIDNLVHIAHNVKVGRNCMIVGQVGISGSTEIGDFTVIGGQAGIAGHLHIGDGVKIGAKSGVIGNLMDGVTVGGFPARPIKEWLRGIAKLRRISLKKGK